MLGIKRPLGARRLDIGIGGGKNEILIIVVLGVIIVGALALAIFSFMGGGVSSAPKGDPPRFKCLIETCGHEWALKVPDPEDIDQSDPEAMLRMEEMMMGGGPGGRITCEKCGQRSAVRMTRCPNPECKAWYVGDVEYYGMQAMERGQELRNVCPKCGTDQQEWYDKRREE